MLPPHTITITIAIVASHRTMAPPNHVPPQLAPSVEEAYRRKCIQLKQRTQEVEEANDASRNRLARTMRQIEKKRIERALLLEQLQRRMSTNVEDSEGSPSPPPTPEEKPLRSKRGHRKASLVGTNNNTAGSTAGGAEGNGEHTGPSSLNVGASFQNAVSPSSDAFSHTNADTQSQNPNTHSKDARANGSAQPNERPHRSAFQLYCAHTRPILTDKLKDDDIDEELAAGWEKLTADEKEEWTAREAEERNKSKDGSASARQEDEDVEMGDNDTEAAPSVGGH